ncbi:MAG TPA: hypothetical protein VGC96_06680 [Candidatus Elarobacter sp.]|jgi:hypothetical protein
MSTAVYHYGPGVDALRRELRKAEAFFVAGIARIVGDVSRLSPGDEDFDYFIPMPASRLDDLSLQICDLELQVQEQFGFSLTAMPIPYAD